MKKRKSKPQSGQALVELALCLPVIFFLAFGLIQLALIGISSFFSHYAAYCAARTYTVYISRGESTALRMAEQAARKAVSACRPRPSVKVTVSKPSLADRSLTRDDLKGAENQYHKITVKMDYPLFLPFPNTNGFFTFESKTTIQNEFSDACKRARKKRINKLDAYERKK